MKALLAVLIAAGRSGPLALPDACMTPGAGLGFSRGSRPTLVQVEPLRDGFAEKKMVETHAGVAAPRVSHSTAIRIRPQPVEARHEQHVAGVENPEQSAELCPVGLRPACHFPEHLSRPGCRKAATCSFSL